MNAERALHELLLDPLQPFGDLDSATALSELMHRHRLRVGEVAGWLHVAESTVCRWRAGENDIPWATWLALHAAVYRCAIREELANDLGGYE